MTSPPAPRRSAARGTATTPPGVGRSITTGPGPRGVLVPPPLQRGDAVAVLAPAFFPRDGRLLAAGMEVLRRWGLTVLPGKSLERRWGYFAGTDEERAGDLQEAMEDSAIKAILFARGGWGVSRIIKQLDLTPLRMKPKTLLGYSDLTVLFAEAWSRVGLSCAYGPVVSELARPEAFHSPSLRRALFRPSEPLELRVPRRCRVSTGLAEGRLVGGCLTLLAHLCGTGRLPDTRGAVVFLEEVAEEPYRVDRMLWQLREAGFFEGAVGVLAGQMTRCEPRPGGRSFTIREVLEDHFRLSGVPVLVDVPAGHGDGKWTLPLGFRATVDAGAGRVIFRP